MRFKFIVLASLSMVLMAVGPEVWGAGGTEQEKTLRFHYPVPTSRQLAWHEMEYYGFIHFTVNTFTDREWGGGDESPDDFQPTNLDCMQWARVARSAGMKGLILTAKHHDGFCLWPSKYTKHSVEYSSWRNGEGDVVGELSQACQKVGLKFGVYLSPWDRNHAEYGHPEYVEYYRNQLRELLTDYGDIFIVWHDGANGGTGYYGGANELREIDRDNYYGFPEVYTITRQLQPKAVTFGQGGSDIRWIGNEDGHAPDTCWAKFDPDAKLTEQSATDHLGQGDAHGTVWRPAEVDVSIRKGWFYHENERPKSLAELLDIYYNSVGKGACLNLNIPPDRSGLIPDADVARLREFRQVLDDTFRHDLAQGKPVSATSQHGSGFSAIKLTDGDQHSYWAAAEYEAVAAVTIDFGKPTVFNRIRIQEYIPLGQRIERFAVEASVDGQWQEITSATTIGARRILRLPSTTADKLRVRVQKSQASPALSTIAVYNATQEP